MVEKAELAAAVQQARVEAFQKQEQAIAVSIGNHFKGTEAPVGEGEACVADMINAQNFFLIQMHPYKFTLVPVCWYM